MTDDDMWVMGDVRLTHHVTGLRTMRVPNGIVRFAIALTETGKPLEPTDEPEHVLTGFCWCQPLVETDPVTGNHLYIHRRSIDSPHIEPEKPRPEETDPERLRWLTGGWLS